MKSDHTSTEQKPPFGDPAYRTYVAKYSSFGWDIPSGAKKPPREPTWMTAERTRLSMGPTLLHPILPIDIGVHKNKNLGIWDFHTPPLLAPQRRVQMSPLHAAMRRISGVQKGLRKELKPVQRAPVIIEEMRASELLVTSEAVREQQRIGKPNGRGTGIALSQMRALESGRGPQPMLLPRGPESTRHVIQSLKLDVTLVKGNKRIDTTAFDNAHHEAMSNSLLAASNGSLLAFREKFDVYDKLPPSLEAASPEKSKSRRPQSAVRMNSRPASALQTKVKISENGEHEVINTESATHVAEAIQLPSGDSRNNNTGLIPRPLSAATVRQMRPPSAQPHHPEITEPSSVKPRKIPSPTRHAIKDAQVFSARNIQLEKIHRETLLRRTKAPVDPISFFIVGKKTGAAPVV
jgi:hypothetical protein